MLNSFRRGLCDGIPIALGYLSVSFTFGIAASNGGMPVWHSLLISMTNLTSAGQLAGLSIILAGGTLFELALSQLVINIRYALMSLTLTQHFAPSVGRGVRALIAFGNTDEIFAVAASHREPLGARYMAGLIALPYVGWSLGTFLGATLGTYLPPQLCAPLGIGIYAMFIAIIIPPSKHSRAILRAVVTSAVLSVLASFIPQLSSGFAIIICAVISAALLAHFSPIEEVEE